VICTYERALGGEGGVSLLCRTTSRSKQMSQFSGSPQASVDYNSTIIGALELSEKKWQFTGSASQDAGIDTGVLFSMDGWGRRMDDVVSDAWAPARTGGGRSDSLASRPTIQRRIALNERKEC
jgi:hypothetical protein